ncbi:alpha/beta hydrolase [Streptomyces sp. NPDC005438]|uniref:alpha/beta fold hydrolase n=1 Tax=Streptomyces sp. NPDC005438 TaxID=3156880 RepID=UPI0033A18C0E
MTTMASTHTTQHLRRDEGILGYDVQGEGPLVVLAPGLGDLRSAYRHLAPRLVHAGYRVATVDLRGHGDSSTGWPRHTRTDTAEDLLALVRHLGGPAVLVGASFAAGSAVIAADREPARVRAVVGLGPGTRKPRVAVRDLNPRFLKGIALLATAMTLRSTRMWGRFLRHANPGPRPDDFDAALRRTLDNLAEPGRMAAASAMGMASPADAEAALSRLTRPALIVMGDLDPDFPDPAKEAEGIARTVPEGPAPAGARVAMIEGTGHYPHSQVPDRVADALLPFLAEVTDA